VTLDHERAQKILERSLAFGAESCPSLERCQLLCSLGDSLGKRRLHREAEQSYREAMTLLEAETLTATAVYAWALYGMGHIRLDHGAPELAEELFMQAKQCYEADASGQLAQKVFFYAAILKSLGVSHGEQRLYDSALKYYSEAMSYLESVGASLHPEFAGIQLSISTCHKLQGNMDTWGEFLGKAKHTFEVTGSIWHPSYNSCTSALLEYHRKCGETN